MSGRLPRAPDWLTKLCPDDRPSMRALPVPLNGRPAVGATDGCAITVLSGVSVPRARDGYELSLARNLAKHTRSRGASLKVVPWERIEAFVAGVRVSDKDRSPGIIARGVTINRQLLKRFLGPLKSATIKVRFGGEHDPVQFIGHGWLVVVMPMRGDTSKPGVRL